MHVRSYGYIQCPGVRVMYDSVHPMSRSTGVSVVRARMDTSNVPEYGYSMVHSCPGVWVQYIPCPGVRGCYYEYARTIHPMSRSTGIVQYSSDYIARSHVPEYRYRIILGVPVSILFTLMHQSMHRSESIPTGGGGFYCKQTLGLPQYLTWPECILRTPLGLAIRGAGDKFWWLPKSQVLRFWGGPQGLKISLKKIKIRCFRPVFVINPYKNSKITHVLDTQGL